MHIYPLCFGEKYISLIAPFTKRGGTDKPYHFSGAFHINDGGFKRLLRIGHLFRYKRADKRNDFSFTLHSAPVVLDFVRDILVLGGNGSLIINNSFVEWSSVRALERAHPRVLVARFGVRDKLKPFSSLLLFSKPRSSDVIPMMEDPLGSFVDVELLSYYIWLKSSLELPYKGKTMYVLAAEGVDEVMVVPPGGPATASEPKETAKPPVSEPASLSDVAVTMAEWLGTRFEHSPGKPLVALLT